jgi:hypothetical protein
VPGGELLLLFFSGDDLLNENLGIAAGALGGRSAKKLSPQTQICTSLETPATELRASQLVHSRFGANQLNGNYSIFQRVTVTFFRTAASPREASCIACRRGVGCRKEAPLSEE